MDETWVTVQTYEDAVMILATCWDDITEVSLDHDLGYGKSGMDVLNYIELAAYGRGHIPFVIHIHSMNFAVVNKMVEIAKTLQEKFGNIKREKA
jgi:transposase